MSAAINIPDDELVSLVEALGQPEAPTTGGEQAPPEPTKSSADDVYADDDEGLDIGTDQPEAQPTPAHEAPETPQPGLRRGKLKTPHRASQRPLRANLRLKGQKRRKTRLNPRPKQTRIKREPKRKNGTMGR